MIKLIGQTLTKGSSLIFDVPVSLAEHLKDGRVSAYAKVRRSDTKTIVLEAVFNSDRSVITVTIPAAKSISFPVGRLIYFVEIAKGLHKIVENEYLLVEP